MPIQAWIDESEANGTLPIFTLTGFIGRAEEWAAFSNDWAAVLAAEPSIPYLSTTMAEGRTSWFRWKKDKRDAKILSLAETMKPYDFTLVYVAVDVSAFRDLFPPEKMPVVPRKSKAFRRMKTLASSPYAFCFQQICVAVCSEALEQGTTDRIELFFDEHEIWKPRVHIMPIDPLFRDDRAEMPLQLADLFAWIIGADLSMKRHELEWLGPALGPIARARRSRAWSRESFEQFAADYSEKELGTSLERALSQFLNE